MIAQSKRWSWYEASVNTGSSFVVSVFVQWLIFPWYGINVTLMQNASIVLIFMAISLVRGYYVRRLFNWLGERQRMIAQKNFRNI